MATVNLLLSGLILAGLLYFRMYFGACFYVGLVLYNEGLNILPKSIRLFIRRDLRAAKGSIIVAIRTFLATRRDKPVCDMFENTCQRYGDKAMFIYQDQKWTFQQIDHYANQVAQYFLTLHKLQKGDCVALFATSCPQYVAIWLGLNKIGCVTSLINGNLKDEPLRHAIAVANSKMVIAGADLWENYETAIDKLTEVRRSFIFSEGKPLEEKQKEMLRKREKSVCWFDDEVSKMPITKPFVKNTAKYFDTLNYIYTSGTTGLPKPCIITSHRMFVYASAHHDILGLSDDDVFYCTLPLYHSAGGAICVGQAIVFGSTIVLRKSFSASKFWDDCVAHKCTVFHYVGELCRYLLAQPKRPNETQHSLQTIYGVGLRPQIWKEFQSRFQIPRICECYGSTEGNTGFVNLDGTAGAIGFTSPLISYMKKQYFIKVDMATGEPIRGKDGFCVECKANEPGELIGKITTGKFSSFDGYLQKEATEKKYLKDVFVKGDLYFRTGDVLVFDDDGYVFFVDRTGDTFRWKGENVSTTEIEGTMSRLIGDVDVAVFGVLIPGCEGRAGMACVGCRDTKVDMKQLSSQVREKLASYARPIFLRFVPDLQVTGTFKIMKTSLREAGFDVNKVGDDSLYYWNTATSQYEHLTNQIYEELMSGKMRF